MLQSEFPLTAHLLGYWHSNEYAAQILTTQAPSGFDICSAADGFAAFLGSHQVAGSRLKRAGDFALPSEALQQAAAIDEALRQAICAKAQAPLQLDPAQAASLACSRLIPRPGLSLIYEQWLLMDLRISLSRGSEFNRQEAAGASYATSCATVLGRLSDAARHRTAYADSTTSPAPAAMHAHSSNSTGRTGTRLF